MIYQIRPILNLNYSGTNAKVLVAGITSWIRINTKEVTVALCVGDKADLSVLGKIKSYPTRRQDCYETRQTTEGSHQTSLGARPTG
jgi:hypothetical protein